MIDFNAKKQARDEWEAEGMILYRQFMESTTEAERAELLPAFMSGDEAQMNAIAEKIQARHRKEAGR